MQIKTAILAAAATLFTVAAVAACDDARAPANQVEIVPAGIPVGEAETQSVQPPIPLEAQIRPKLPSAADALVEEGRKTFRYDTFGDEAFWGAGGLGLERVIAGSELGGVGLGVSPKLALSVGLKVDADALPSPLVAQLRRGEVDLDDPAVTVALLELDAVIGLKGTVEAGKLTNVGITCALCHSTVDDSFAPGIGKRLDGWAARDLDVGAIVNLLPDLTPIAKLLGVEEDTVRTVLTSWGPGKYDPLLFVDGKAFRPDGKTAAVVLPPAFGLAGVNLHTYTGFGSVPYWNAFVAVVQMHGQGNFLDERFDDAARYPVAARNRTGHIQVERDLVGPKLPALQAYQSSLRPPVPPKESFDEEAAGRGEELFMGAARCAGCHIPPLYTESGYNLHRAEAIGIDDFQALRSPEQRYRTTPLRGLWTHQKGGFYHDGRFSTLLDVINHYDRTFGLGLDEAQKNDLSNYLLAL